MPRHKHTVRFRKLVMPPQYKLSYVLTTRNKLTFLKEVMTRLLYNRQSDEEIVVIDGASNDGTVEYLSELHRAGQVDQFVSEPDRGEAHGYNKALLMARGDLVKFITDDDAFFYPGIQACRGFMQEHTKIDVLATSGAAANWSKSDLFERYGEIYESWYELWQQQARPFAFCGLGLMIRRDSIPLVGLLNTAFARVDMEFSLRITAGLANLAWYTADTWVRVTNPQGNSNTQAQRVHVESDWLELFYSSSLPGGAKQSWWAKSPRAISHGIKRRLGRMFKRPDAPKTLAEPAPTSPFGDWPATFEVCDRWLAERNVQDPGCFLFRARGEDAVQPERLVTFRAAAVQRVREQHSQRM